MVLIALGYSVNGLFEGLTPFGPGVKCYYMWLLFGILVGKPASGVPTGKDNNNLWAEKYR